MALFVHGQDVRARGSVKPGLGFPLAALLELAQCGRVFLAPTAQAAFLNADIVELPLIGQEDLGFDQMLAFTEDLEELREWLRKLKVKQIAMESTGVYWIPVWNVLERSKKKFELVLVNPQHVRALPGRKTDQQDGERIAELMQYGLLRGSFIPPRPIRELRELTRRRVHQLSDRNRSSIGSGGCWKRPTSNSGPWPATSWVKPDG
jgi:Transposase